MLATTNLRLGLSKFIIEEATKEIDRLLSDQNSFVRWIGSFETASNVKARLLCALADIGTLTVSQCWEPVINSIFGEKIKTNVFTGDSYPYQFYQLALKLEIMHVDESIRRILVTPSTQQTDLSEDYKTSVNFDGNLFHTRPRFKIESGAEGLDKRANTIKEFMLQFFGDPGPSTLDRITKASRLISYAFHHFGHKCNLGGWLKNPQNWLLVTQNIDPVTKSYYKKDEGNLLTDLSPDCLERFIRDLSNEWTFLTSVIPDEERQTGIGMTLTGCLNLILSSAKVTFDDPSSSIRPTVASFAKIVAKHGPNAISSVLSKDPKLGFQTLMNVVVDLIGDVDNNMTMITDLCQSAGLATPLIEPNQKLKDIQSRLDADEDLTVTDILYLDRIRDIEMSTTPTLDVAIYDTLPTFARLSDTGPDRLHFLQFLTPVTKVFKLSKKIFSKLFGSKKKKKKAKKKREAMLRAEEAQLAQQQQQQQQQFQQTYAPQPQMSPYSGADLGAGGYSNPEYQSYPEFAQSETSTENIEGIEGLESSPYGELGDED